MSDYTSEELVRIFRKHQKGRKGFIKAISDMVNVSYRTVRLLISKSNRVSDNTRSKLSHVARLLESGRLTFVNDPNGLPHPHHNKTSLRPVIADPPPVAVPHNLTYPVEFMRAITRG